ncbi:MAG: hypothetical protein AABX28_01345 [Nanoarchaeota archaeon]
MVSKKPSQVRLFFQVIGKKAQMEMSVGTIVTIVLLMTVLILGLVMVRTIFKGSIENINSIDQSVKNEINKLFSEGDSKIVIFPPSRKITINKDDGEPSGFAFSIRNEFNDEKNFAYTVKADPEFDYSDRCGSFSEGNANDLLLVSSGSFTIGQADSLDLPELVLFEIPKGAPSCTIPYRVNVKIQSENYAEAKIYLTIK